MIMEQVKVQIVAHRGRSDLFPQNTIQAIQLGLLTADLSQFDVLLTKDNQLVVFHDRYLGKLTNISQLQIFNDRKLINDLDQFGSELHLQWWVKDFTLQQLSKLEVIQKHPNRPQIKNKRFMIISLQELIQQCLSLKIKNPHLKAGFLLQIKSERQNLVMCERDQILLQRLKQCLDKYKLCTKAQAYANNLPIIIQTFNHQLLKKWVFMGSDLQAVHLYYNETHLSEQLIKSQLSSRSFGIGISDTLLTEQIVQICKNNHLKIFYWTVVDDSQTVPFKKSNFGQVYAYLKKNGVYGIITDFAQNCKKYLEGM